MTIYDKAEAPDLSPREKRALKAAIDAETAARQVRQKAQERKLRRGM